MLELFKIGERRCAFFPTEIERGYLKKALTEAGTVCRLKL